VVRSIISSCGSIYGRIGGVGRCLSCCALSSFCIWIISALKRNNSQSQHQHESNCKGFHIRSYLSSIHFRAGSEVLQATIPMLAGLSPLMLLTWDDYFFDFFFVSAFLNPFDWVGGGVGGLPRSGDGGVVGVGVGLTPHIWAVTSQEDFSGSETLAVKGFTILSPFRSKLLYSLCRVVRQEGFSFHVICIFG
jgi:hypothetical protein